MVELPDFDKYTIGSLIITIVIITMGYYIYSHNQKIKNLENDVGLLHGYVEQIMKVINSRPWKNDTSGDGDTVDGIDVSDEEEDSYKDPIEKKRGYDNTGVFMRDLADRNHITGGGNGRGR
jgi:hypothetical protein